MSAGPSDAPRNARLGLRVDESDKSLLAQAAELEHTTVTSFVMDAARTRAERVLAEHRTVRVSAETYDRFVAALDEAPAPKPRLRKLLNEGSKFRRR
jgi:uncharacterized protein (DUF1778 family)